MTTEDDEAARGRGQPSPYREEYCKQARVLARRGATDADLAEAFDVCLRTIFNWRAAHPEFAEACKVGKDAADDEAERSLYSRVRGYDYEAEEVFCYKGQITRARVMKHIPPDPTSCFMWLTNRRQKEWRHRRELSGPEGGPIDVITRTMPLNEAVSAYAQLVSSEGTDFDEDPSPDSPQNTPDQP